MKYHKQVKNYQHVKMTNCEDISHKPCIQTYYIPVASDKQAFKKGTSLILKPTRLFQNTYYVKGTMSGIRGNRSNIVPLQYIQFLANIHSSVHV